MLPMVPHNRDDRIPWLAARFGGSNYGTAIEFAFSKGKLVYSPAQIEARIDRDTTISQQFSLWNRTGSRVIRGNLLVILIDVTLLYVEPLYLSAESRQLCEPTGTQLPPAGAKVEALNHYRRAVDALSRGDWRTFGAEMDAMRRSLQGTGGKPPS